MTGVDVLKAFRRLHPEATAVSVREFDPGWLGVTVEFGEGRPRKFFVQSADEFLTVQIKELAFPEEAGW